MHKIDLNGNECTASIIFSLASMPNFSLYRPFLLRTVQVLALLFSLKQKLSVNRA